MESDRLNTGKMDMHNNNNNNHNNTTNTNMDDSAMMRYLLGKYGLPDLVGMMRSMAANGEDVPQKRPWRQ